MKESKVKVLKFDCACGESEVVETIFIHEFFGEREHILFKGWRIDIDGSKQCPKCLKVSE